MTKSNDSTKSQKTPKSQDSAKAEAAEALPPTTTEARAAGGEAGRKRREVYRQIKAFAVEHEKTNYSKLFVFHDRSNWWKMVGHSALFFHYEISGWINMSSKLLYDTDYDFRSEDGVVNIRDIYALDGKLTSVNIHPLYIADEYRVYNIGKKYTEADIEALRKTHELEWAKINTIIFPKEVFPQLYVAMKEFLGNIYFSTRTLEAYEREVIGKPMLEKVVMLMNEYSLLCNSAGLTVSGYLERAQESMDWIIGQMASIAGLKLMPTDRIYQILHNADKIKRCIDQCRPKQI